LSEQNPLVLVFEDLQWADDNLLDFVEHLVDWAAGVPMLVVCNTRPELFERRHGWAGATRNAITLSLAPLSDAETSQLMSSLGKRPVMSAETQEALLARAGGNPLYAEQYVRMLAERSDADALPLPETVQGIIAARLDALSLDEKRLLQDAAVLGKVFWLGAVAQAGGLSRSTAEVRLHALERKDFVQRARRSSVAEEVEYSFMHVLVRDVAYGQIPRSERAEKHRLAAEWIALLGRTEDHAEMLAHHYRSALELRGAAGQPVDPTFARQVLESLRDAGERAYSLNAYALAGGFFASASELVEAGSPERARLLFRLGRSRYLAGDLEPGLLEEASAELRACGCRETAAEVEAVLTELSWLRGDADRALEHRESARDLVDAGDPSRVRAYVISTVSRYLMLAGEDEEAIRLGREALAMADHLGIDELRAHALNNIGVSRMDPGDLGGLEDLEQSVAIAAGASAPAEICRAQNNLAAVLWAQGQLERANAILAEGMKTASRFGQVGMNRWFRGLVAINEYSLGHWREALAGSDEFIAEVEAGSPHYGATGCYLTRAFIRLGQGDVRGSRRRGTCPRARTPRQGSAKSRHNTGLVDASL
jgi:tetratricopeptide (TPR) repeat protein